MSRTLLPCLGQQGFLFLLWLKTVIIFPVIASQRAHWRSNLLMTGKEVKK